MVVRFASRKGSLWKSTQRLLEEAGYEVRGAERSYRPSISDPELRLKVLRPHPSETNFLLMGVPGSSSELRAALRERRILVRDVGDIPHVGPCLRITVGLPWMNRRLIEALSEVLESLES